MNLLVFNCGSSSIKYQLFNMPDGKVLAKGLIEKIGEPSALAKQSTHTGKEIRLEQAIADHDAALALMKEMLTDPKNGAVASITEIQACGHRLVHGGEEVSGSVAIDASVIEVIERYADLAPLHNPPNLKGVRAAQNLMPNAVQVGCFDTAFHSTLPEYSYLYALPYSLYEKYKIRKYGFHGTSHAFVANRAAALLNKPLNTLRLITCHLGNGCSMAAVLNGKSVDTSMGLTPLEGLVMGTRTGDFDPAVIFYLARKGHKPEDLDNLFNKKAGLLGISGISNDVRVLEEQAAAGQKQAQLALDMFAYRARKYIGAYMAVLNGCDCIVFTGGIGENGSAMRKRICGNLDGLGIVMNEAANKTVVCGKEGLISLTDSAVKVLVVPTNEEAAIAADTYRIAKGST